MSSNPAERAIKKASLAEVFLMACKQEDLNSQEVSSTTSERHTGVCRSAKADESSEWSASEIIPPSAPIRKPPLRRFF